MTDFSHMTDKRKSKEHRKNGCVYSVERQPPVKFRSLPSPPAAAAPDGAAAAPRLYAPRWNWSAASSISPPVLGDAPQCHPLDILGVLGPPRTAASIHCTFPGAILSATERATQAFGAPPFAVLLTILAACEGDLPGALRASSADPPIRIGLFGPGAAAARHAAVAIHPDAARHLVDLYAVRGTPEGPNADPLPRGIWPVLCPAYLPTWLATALTPMPLPTELTYNPDNSSRLAGFAVEPVACSQRDVLVSICADDAEASYLPPDVRRRVTALPRLLDRLYATLSVLAPIGGAHGSIDRFQLDARASLADEMAEAAFELAMVARAHLIGFYARTRPARTGPVHRAAAAMLRHRPPNISATTLTSVTDKRDLYQLEAAGWLEARDEETARGLAHRFVPTDEFLALDLPELPRKRPSLPRLIKVLCDGA